MSEKQDDKKQKGVFPSVEHQFQKGNTLGKGRPPGKRNKSTLYRAALKIPYLNKDGEKLYFPEDHPLFPGEMVMQEDMIAHTAVQHAILGDKDARRDSLNAAYGKDPDVVINDPDVVNRMIADDLTPAEAAAQYQKYKKEMES